MASGNANTKMEVFTSISKSIQVSVVFLLLLRIDLIISGNQILVHVTKMSLVAFTHSSRLIEPDVERRPVIDLPPLKKLLPEPICKTRVFNK